MRARGKGEEGKWDEWEGMREYCRYRRPFILLSRALRTTKIVRQAAVSVNLKHESPRAENWKILERRQQDTSVIC